MYVSSNGRKGGGSSKGKPIAVMLLALTIVRMPARCAANSTWNDAVTLLSKVVTSGISPFTGTAARCTIASSPPWRAVTPRNASRVCP